MDSLYGGYYDGAGHIEDAKKFIMEHWHMIAIAAAVIIVAYYLYTNVSVQGLATGTASLSAGGSNSDQANFQDYNADHNYPSMSADDVLGSTAFNCSGRTIAPTSAFAWQQQNIGGASAAEYEQFTGGLSNNDASKALRGY